MIYSYYLSLFDLKYFLGCVFNVSGNAGDSLTYHHGRPFSTQSQDKDNWGGGGGGEESVPGHIKEPGGTTSVIIQT